MIPVRPRIIAGAGALVLAAAGFAVAAALLSRGSADFSENAVGLMTPR